MSSPDPAPTDHAPVDPAPARRDPAPSGAGAPAPRANRYLSGSAANMIRSLVVIGAILAAALALVPRGSQVVVPDVDPAADAVAVGRTAGLPFEVASGLPAGWTAENTRYTKTSDGAMTWQVTYRTPDGDPVAVKQAEDPGTGWVELATAAGEEQGETTVGGRTWLVYHSAEKEQYALLHRPAAGERLTTAVLGQASLADVEELAAALTVPSP